MMDAVKIKTIVWGNHGMNERECRQVVCKNSVVGRTERAIYQIRVKGHLDGSWSEWLGGLAFVHKEDGTTALTGPVADQSALYGLLVKIRDLGLPLVSVNDIESCSERKANDESESECQNQS